MKRILIIDDNEEILYALSEILKYKGWEAITATNVEMGIELFKDNDVDLVIIDYHMPLINGMLGVKIIRSISDLVPIIVLTVEESQETADAFMDAGANDFALKPIKAPDLLARLTVHLNSVKIKKEDIKYKDYHKGISLTTLEIIETYMKNNNHKMTMNELSKNTGLAYQTVHRYLQHLMENDMVELEQDYGKVGRPKQYYKWVCGL